MMEEQRQFVKDLDRYTETIKELRLDVERLTHENEITFKELRLNGDAEVDLENEQYLEVENAEETFVKRIDDLERHIQKESYKRVEERCVRIIFLSSTF